MTYNVVAVCENGEDSYPLFPVLNDEILVTGEPLDGGFGTALQVSKIVVRRKVGNSYKTVLATKDISFQVWITASRVVFYCKKFEKGGGWVGFGLGGLAVAVVANSVSMAVAASRRKGKALVGNLRYPWISRVSFSPRNGFGTDDDVRLTFVDGTDNSRPECDITFSLSRGSDANRTARHIVDRIIAYRYASGEQMDADELAGFEALRLSGLIAPPQKGYLSSYRIPSSWRVPIGLTKVPAVPPVAAVGPPAGILKTDSGATPDGPVIQPAIEPVIEPVNEPAVARQAFCTSCGSAELGENFCTDCGAALTAAL